MLHDKHTGELGEDRLETSLEDRRTLKTQLDYEEKK